ncbi:kinase-like domain-containing protein [Phialemonium atrogriseum]|uniref:Kinase-like domain-containing protein n=1 Tax=Phialemonium atrogriseum TaxID=1093897 RepID=A0AAJ0BZS5_9PEZI|nr:kinase-like domain-containing protein [Phialemonium atrogriseum]KAK1767525.1 kinase-like domain-containing protein [Phialemonium atrogriseum]
MPSTLRFGQVLRGRLETYTISRQIQDLCGLQGLNHANMTFVVKSVRGHPRVENERDILRRFQDRASHNIRPMIDEIEDPAEPTSITLNRKEIKYISKRVLQALSVLHKDDVKLNNVFVNYRDGEDEVRFSDVQLGDFGSTSPQDSEWAKTGTVIGRPLWNSPEVLIETPWNTATDIWSFGTVLISLIYGGDFNIFRPKNAHHGNKNYNVEVVMSQYRYFGPFPPKYREIANKETLMSISYIMNLIPPEAMMPFRFVTELEVSKEDKEFILKIMKMDWRDRPTAKELLQDEWFAGE